MICPAKWTSSASDSLAAACAADFEGAEELWLEVGANVYRMWRPGELA